MNALEIIFVKKTVAVNELAKHLVTFIKEKTEQTTHF